MRLSILGILLALSAGACTAPDGSGAPGSERALRAELDDATCEELRAVMADALQARADAAGEQGDGEQGAGTGGTGDQGAGSAPQPAPAAPASMFIPIPGPGLLNRLFSDGSDETAAADPDAVYRAAHEAYESRGCTPAVPFGES